jgi:hypothetical protein
VAKRVLKQGGIIQADPNHWDNRCALVDMPFILFAPLSIQGALQLNISKTKADADDLLTIPVLVT